MPPEKADFVPAPGDDALSAEQQAAADSAVLAAKNADDPAAKAAAEAAAAEAAAAKPPVTLDDPEPAAPKVPEAGTVVEYNKTGDAGLDVALQFVGARGFGPEHPGIVAAQKGDFTVLKEALAALGDKAKGFESYVALAEESYGRRTAATAAQAEAAAKVVYEAAGGADKWAAIREWARANATPEEKASLNAAINAGGFAAKAAVKELAALYQRSGAAGVKSAVKSDAPAATGAGDSGALDPKAFGRESAKLYAKLGNRMQASPEYQALVQRRLAYRAPQ